MAIVGAIRRKTKSEIEEQMRRVEEEVCRRRANIAEETFMITAAKARLKQLEIERDTAMH